jgi:tripartite-type tricarboxylate transporter receptor subunit TctC
MGGHIDAAFNSSVRLIASKNELKVLAIGSEKRMSPLPDVPTFKESGLDYYPPTRGGVIAPKGVPVPILKRPERAFREAVAREICAFDSGLRTFTLSGHACSARK